MPISVQCAGCSAKYKVAEGAAGKQVKCKKCGAAMRVVAAAAPVETAPRREAADDEEFLDNLAREETTAEVVPNAFQPVGRVKERKNCKEIVEDVAPRTIVSARIIVRLIILAVLLIPVVVVQRLSWTERLLSCFLPLMLTGTYRVSSMRGHVLKTRFHAMFIPITSQQCDLRTVAWVESKYADAGPGWGTYLLLGPVQWIFSWLFDLLIPAIGAPYQLRLMTAKGRGVPVWEGHQNEEFRRILGMLLEATKAEHRPWTAGLG